MAFNPGKFLREVRTESAKIVWPTRRETLLTGLMVVIMTSLLAIFFFAVDYAFSARVHFLLGLVSRTCRRKGFKTHYVPLVHHPRLFGLREQGPRRDHGRGHSARPDSA